MNHASQTNEFVKQGFVTLRDVVDISAASKARGLVNRAIGLGVDPEQALASKKSTWFPELTGSPALVRLFNECSPLQSFLASMLGDRSFLQYGCQIALRFPGDLCMESDVGEDFSPVPFWADMWHIDGIPDEHNGLQQGKIHGFTLLVGIPLQTVAAEFSGGLVVFPGSHFDTERYFLANGHQGALTGGLSSMQVPLRNDARQVACNVGDVIIAHHNLAHSIAPNCAADTRYMLYFRVNVHQSFDPLTMADIFRDFLPHVQQLAARERQLAATQAGTVKSSGYVDAKVPQGRRRNQVDPALLEEAKNLFDSHQWSAAADIYKQLVEKNRARLTFWQRFQAAIAMTWSEDEDNWLMAESILRELKRSFGKFPLISSSLAQNLMRHEHYDKAEVSQLATDAIMSCAKADEEAPDFVVQCLQTLQTCGASNLHEVILVAKQRYPKLAVQIDQQANTGHLWVQGQQWLASEPKDIQAGVLLFGQICRCNPQDYWATLLYGGCMMWAGDCRAAESVLIRANELDPTLPHSYSALAQCLEKLHRDPISIIERMLDQDGLKVENKDAEEKVIEAFQVAHNHFFAAGDMQRYQHLKNVGKTLFPSLSGRLDAIKNQEVCVVF